MVMIGDYMYREYIGSHKRDWKPQWDHSPLLPMSLVDGRRVLPEPIGWLCLQLDFPPLVAELFRLPLLKSGTLYRNTSS